jgi:hypothetical protein
VAKFVPLVDLNQSECCPDPHLRRMSVNKLLIAISVIWLACLAGAFALVVMSWL